MKGLHQLRVQDRNIQERVIGPVRTQCLFWSHWQLGLLAPYSFLVRNPQLILPTGGNAESANTDILWCALRYKPPWILSGEDGSDAALDDF